MLAEKRTRAQPPTPMLMSIPPFKPPSVALSGPSVSSAAGIDSTSHAASSQQYNSSHPIHPLQQPPHQQQQHPQKQYLHLIHPQQNVSLTAPTSHQPQLSQAIQNCPPPPQQQHHPQHQQHQKVQSTHPRRGSVDRGTIKDPFKLKSSSISKAASEYVGPYLLGKTLGKGSSGCVKLARHRKTNEQAAVKIISKASLVNRAAVHRGIEREIAIMKLINHPHVIRLYDVYETEKELFLVMEYVSGGELFEYLVNKGRLDETEALRFFQQIIVGLAFCHKRKICHRDLKPENLLLDDRMNVKIADFGMASLQKSGRLLETSCGSPHYASPEVVTGMKYDGSSSDIWSCGIILYALLTGHLPFDDENIRQLLSKVKAGKFYMPTDISAGARDLISRMLTVNPKRRITMQGVMMHPWFRMVNPERNTLGEPAQDPESGRSIQVEELDAEILLHMRWLFAPGPSHSNPEAKEVFDEEALLVEIQEKMTSNEENMEKLFYHLLCQHKAELLENYIEDGSDIMPDAPRRRADSFPNSATCSIRSKTPEFGRSPLSPRDSPAASPGSPLSPVVKGMDPTPLTLNPEATLNSMHSSRMNEVKRGQSPAVMCESSLIKNDATNTPSRQDILDSENRSKALLDGDQETSKPMRKDDSGRGEDIMKNDSKSTFTPKPTPGNGSAHESLMSVNASNGSYQATMVTTATEGIHTLAPTSSCTAAQLPPLHPTETAGLATHLYSNSEEVRKKGYVAVHAYDSTTPSIESQVMSTQISENSYSSSSECSAPVPLSLPAHHTPTNGVSNISEGDIGSPLNTSSAERVMPTASSIRGPRPKLHPLDVKASGGTTAMNISVPQHSRKYSEGTSSMISTTPLSPKRPWFARLFDFKPQPLMFKSHVSAVEAQERVETILKNLFHSSIQIDAYKKPAFGVKCRFEGGAIDEQPVKPVKFKVDISEKAVFLPVDRTNSSNSSNSSRTVSSSAVAAVLATVELHNNVSSNNCSNSSSSSCSNNASSGGLSKFGPCDSSSSSSNGGCGGSIAPMTAAPPIVEPKRHIFSGASKKSSDILAGRRASDGGSILSSAAAAMTSHFASKIHLHSNSNSNAGHRHSVHGIIPNMGGRGQGQVPQPQMQMRRVVKVTLHQQQGANSTLRMIYERLCAAWDIPLHLQEQECQEQVLVATPMSATAH